MLGSLSKITGHAKKLESTLHNKNINDSIKTAPENNTDVRISKDINIAIITEFHMV